MESGKSIDKNKHELWCVQNLVQLWSLIMIWQGGTGLMNHHTKPLFKFCTFCNIHMFLLPEMCTPCFRIVALHGYAFILNLNKNSWSYYNLLVPQVLQVTRYISLSKPSCLFCLCCVFFSWKHFIHPFMCYIIYLVRYYLYIETRHGSWHTTSKRC